MLADNGERTAASIRCEPSDRLVRNLLRAPIAGDCEQPIAPRCHKYRRFRHGLPSLSRRLAVSISFSRKERVVYNLLEKKNQKKYQKQSQNNYKVWSNRGFARLRGTPGPHQPLTGAL
jgi:hypothetical protein